MQVSERQSSSTEQSRPFSQGSHTPPQSVSVSPPSRSPFSQSRSRVIPPVPPLAVSLGTSNEGEVHDAVPPSATASKTSIPLSRRESAGWDMDLLHTVNRIARCSNPSS